MRQWMLLSAGAITALLIILFALLTGDEAGPSAIAGPLAVQPHATDTPRPATGSAPSLAPEHTPPPELTRNPELAQMVRDLATHSDAELDDKLAAIDKEIGDGKLVEHANAGSLSTAEHAALGALLRRRNAVNIAKTQRLIARLDALDNEDAVAKTRLKTNPQAKTKTP